MNNHNALDNLASEMGDDFSGYRTDTAILKKAKLIISELAKIQIEDNLHRKLTARGNCLDYQIENLPSNTIGIFTNEHFPKWFCSALNAIEKCRVIAKGE